MKWIRIPEIIPDVTGHVESYPRCCYVFLFVVVGNCDLFRWDSPWVTLFQSMSGDIDLHDEKGQFGTNSHCLVFFQICARWPCLFFRTIRSNELNLCFGTISFKIVSTDVHVVLVKIVSTDVHVVLVKITKFVIILFFRTACQM